MYTYVYMMSSRKRSKAELRESLRKHLGFLQRSAEWYDAGHEAEAERIAVSLRVLFHTTSSSKSLMNLLCQESIVLRSITDDLGEGTTTRSQIKWDVRYDPHRIHALPLLGSANSHRDLLFKDWWEGEKVTLALGHPGNRRALVLSLANRDGAHIDPQLTDEDEFLRSLHDLTTWVERAVEGCPPTRTRKYKVTNALHANVRQIAHEVLESPALRKLTSKH